MRKSKRERKRERERQPTMPYLQVVEVVDRHTGVEALVSGAGLCLPEVAVPCVWQSLPVQQTLQHGERLREEAKVSEHTDLEDAAIHTALDIAAHKGGEVLVQRQQRKNLPQERLGLVRQGQSVTGL